MNLDSIAMDAEGFTYLKSTRIVGIVACLQADHKARYRTSRSTIFPAPSVPLLTIGRNLAEKIVGMEHERSTGDMTIPAISAG